LALLVLTPRGGWRTALEVGRDAALLIWAADEMLRGVNPFRRTLGLAVVAFTLVGILGP